MGARSGRTPSRFSGRFRKRKERRFPVRRGPGWRFPKRRRGRRRRLRAFERRESSPRDQRAGRVGRRLRRARRAVPPRGGATAAARRAQAARRAGRPRAANASPMAGHRRPRRRAEGGVLAPRAPGVPALEHAPRGADAARRAGVAHRAGVHPGEPRVRGRDGRSALEAARRSLRARRGRERICGVARREPGVRAHRDFRPVPAPARLRAAVDGDAPGARGFRAGGGGARAHAKQRRVGRLPPGRGREGGREGTASSVQGVAPEGDRRRDVREDAPFRGGVGKRRGSRGDPRGRFRTSDDRTDGCDNGCDTGCDTGCDPGGGSCRWLDPRRSAVGARPRAGRRRAVHS